MCFQLFDPCPDAGRGLLRLVVVVQRKTAEHAVLGRRGRTVTVAFRGGLADQKLAKNKKNDIERSMPELSKVLVVAGRLELSTSSV